MAELRVPSPAAKPHAGRADTAAVASRRALAAFVARQGVRLGDNGRGQLTALVTYRAPFGTVTLATRITVWGAGPWTGRVRLAPRAVLTADWYQLEFSAEGAEYRVEQPNDILSVRGLSQRLGGHYRVWLEPLAGTGLVAS